VRGRQGVMLMCPMYDVALCGITIVNAALTSHWLATPGLDSS